MYRVTTGIHIHFGHHVRGHRGPCISVHGHTWKFDVTLASTSLDAEGFVLDFDLVHERVLTPCHKLLDHSFAVGPATWEENREALAMLGERLVASRQETMGSLGERQDHVTGDLAGARNEFPGGIKVAVFPFTPTSERLAEWLYDLAEGAVGTDRVRVAGTRIFETLHPVDSIAEYTR